MYKSVALIKSCAASLGLDRVRVSQRGNLPTPANMSRLTAFGPYPSYSVQIFLKCCNSTCLLWQFFPYTYHPFCEKITPQIPI